MMAEEKLPRRTKKKTLLILTEILRRVCDFRDKVGVL